MRIDFDAEGRPIGVEITAPSQVTIADLNAVLATIGAQPLDAEEWTPLAA